VDTTLYSSIGHAYDFVTKQFQFQLPAPLANGTHKAVLTAGPAADSVTFTVQAGFVQITTRGGFSTRWSQRTILGVVEGGSIDSVKLVRNGIDSIAAPIVNKTYTVIVPLVEGTNTLQAVVRDSSGTLRVSDPIIITRIIDHAPVAVARALFADATTVTLTAANSSDPDSQTITYEWRDDPRTPLGLTGQTGSTAVASKPTQAGEHFFGLIVRDPNGNADTTTAYFTITETGGLEAPTIASNPEWARRARVYFLFPKAASATGNLNGAALRLPIIKQMGFNVVWLMPVMKNAYPIDQGYGPGYNIVDFYNVAPEYGTNQDFKNFVDQAHALGLKVILDVTPNHTSRFHPFSVDAHAFKQASPYWNWYQHATDGSNTNGLGWGTDADGFVYYGGFGEQLLNYNWNDIDARTEMINVYKYWIQQFGIDGYRFDVYWGPHRRYGEVAMGKPVRDALKRIKPDILLLAEDDGTGSGTETIYADYVNAGINGGVDAAYDFKLYFNQIRGFQWSASAVDNLHNEVNNSGYYPGPNALYMRFMESQDEDRLYAFAPYYDANPEIAYRKTMPMASVLFTVPGFPMIWNGQEVGWGYGIAGAKEARNRSTINWNAPGGTILAPHYQRLASIRGAFNAFATQQFARLSSSNGIVYAFARPRNGEHAIVVTNFSGAQASATVTIPASALPGVADGTPYMLSDVYRDSSWSVQFTASQLALPVTLPAYGTSILILAGSARTVEITPISGVEDERWISEVPTEFGLLPNYPNPFNPETVVSYHLPAGQAGLSVASEVDLRIYDLLGREVKVLVNREMQAGTHRVNWNATRTDGSSVSTGVYLVRLQAGGKSATQKIVFMK
ncbi:MAG: alpha-amylase family glycosyl hydrolase, partial [Bacteroidetes bacterium]|jgi:glycosidase|nr:alpha-amylase family glycosyl hydrolase [Bacteroidota bacterium]